MSIKLSIVIPTKSKDDPKLADLLRSIEAQDFPKDQMEILVITEGTSESAKAIGIRKAKGEVIGILASDNVIPSYPKWLETLCFLAKLNGAVQPAYYEHRKSDDALTRYFALIGNNDPLAFYMNKNDRFPRYLGPESILRITNGRTIGDNGYFVVRDLIGMTDLDNYYHIDNANEVPSDCVTYPNSIVHNTGGNIFTFFAKRYRYGLQHAFNSNRRWHLVDFSRKEDICRLVWFIVASLTVVHPLVTSIRGYLKLRDLAWFMHPIVCLMTLFTYTALVIHITLRRFFQSLFAHTEGKLL